MKRLRIFGFFRGIIFISAVVACYDAGANIVAPPPALAPRSQCYREDSLMLVLAQGSTASGNQLTTYWYDSTGARTAHGLDGHGCLAGFKNDTA